MTYIVVIEGIPTYEIECGGLPKLSCTIIATECYMTISNLYIYIFIYLIYIIYLFCITKTWQEQ